MPMRIKFATAFFLALASLPVFCRAAVPPAEQLLPADTLAVFTVPDWQKAQTDYRQWPIVQFWEAAEMKPFRDKFLAKFKADAIAPLEKELGVKLADYTALIQGQLTLAVTQNGWTGQTGQSPGIVLLIDTKDKAPQLQQTLANLKKRWVDSGKSIKTEKVREVEFTTLIVHGADFAKAFKPAIPSNQKKAAPKDAGAKAPAEKVELSVGQAGSLLLVGSEPKVFEKILVRLSGGAVPYLAEVAAYEANRNAMFREASAYGWANFRILGDIIIRQAASPATGAPQNPLAPKPDKMMEAIGIRALETLAFSMSQSPQGLYAHLFVGVPEARRNGVFKVLAGEAKETAPPPFVPADVVKYNRWRLDGKKLWAALESLLTDISPALGGMLQTTLDTLDKAGKEKDPSFDLKGRLIGNLGDDLITYEKPPRSSKPGDLNSPPSLVLVGALNAEQLAHTLKTALGFMAPPGSDSALKEREFLGRKIHSWPLPALPSVDSSKPAARSFNFAAGGGYLAMSGDVALLEEFLRSSTAQGRPLRDTAGLNDAAQKVGGLNTGLFGYENQSETFRFLFDALKKDPDAFEKIFTRNFFALPAINPQDRKNREQWFDFSLLPAWETVAKYFYFTVYGGNGGPQGLSYKVFSPTPPQLRK